MRNVTCIVRNSNLINGVIIFTTNLCSAFIGCIEGMMGPKKSIVFLKCTVDHLMIQEWRRERREKKKAFEEGAVDNFVDIDFTLIWEIISKNLSPPPKHRVVSLYYLFCCSNPLLCSGWDVIHKIHRRSWVFLIKKGMVSICLQFSPMHESFSVVSVYFTG